LARSGNVKYAAMTGASLACVGPYGVRAARAVPGLGDRLNA